MDAHDLPLHIGRSLRHLRQSLGLSLDDVARLTGVSKPMLSQMERGESSPTVVTLWKIASGLGVPFSTFLRDAETPPAILLRQSDQTLVTDDAGTYQVRSIFAWRPPHHPAPVDCFEATLLPGAVHRAEAHGPAIREAVWVMAGQLVIEIGTGETGASERSTGDKRGVRYTLETGDALHFVADTPHTYCNPGPAPTSFAVLLAYPTRA